MQHAHPTRGGPSRIGPGATSVRVTGLFGGSAVTPCQTARRCRGPKRWLENLRPPGAMRSKPTNTARGTLERRRTCGYRQSERRPRPGPPFRFGVATCRSPWVRRTPGVPRALGLFPQAHRPNDSGAKRAARTMEAACHRGDARIHYYGQRWGIAPGTIPLNQAATICRCRKLRRERMQCRIAPRPLGLAPVNSLRYHSHAITDEDPERQSASKKI